MPEVLTKVDPDDSVEKLSRRELDAEVAATVMNIACDCERTPDGSRWCHRHGTGDGIGTRPYSTSIDAAMLVVEKMRADKWDIQITSDDESPAWQVSFDARGAAGKLLIGEHQSDSLPEAICRAALKAVGAE